MSTSPSFMVIPTDPEKIMYQLVCKVTMFSLVYYTTNSIMSARVLIYNYEKDCSEELDFIKIQTSLNFKHQLLNILRFKNRFTVLI